MKNLTTKVSLQEIKLKGNGDREDLSSHNEIDFKTEFIQFNTIFTKKFSHSKIGLIRVYQLIVIVFCLFFMALFIYSLYN